MGFDWDQRKARVNLSKHGVAFDEAATVFDDPLYFVQREKFLIMLLVGGDKSSQERDIKRAKMLADALKE